MLRITPRRIRFAAVSAKDRSTWFNHELLVGMQGTWYSGWRRNHRFTAGALCVP